MFVLEMKRSQDRKKGGKNQGVGECHRLKGAPLPQGHWHTGPGESVNKRDPRTWAGQGQQPLEMANMEMCPCVYHRNAPGPSFPLLKIL